MKQRAEETARYLEEIIWSAPPEQETGSEQTHWPREEYPLLSDRRIGVDTTPIREEEVSYVIKKMKRRKAPGPDQVPIELLKEMDSDNLREITSLLQEWWEKEDIPPEALQARVVLIFKKGNANDLGNFRPISLLNSMYKIFASVLQKRLAATMEENFQLTQFSFKRKKSTADALHC